MGKIFKNSVGCVIRTDDDNMKVGDIDADRMGTDWTDVSDE